MNGTEHALALIESTRTIHRKVAKLKIKSPELQYTCCNLLEDRIKLFFRFPLTSPKFYIPMSKVRGSSQDKPPQLQGQGQRPREATQHPRSRKAAKRSNPTSKEWQLHGCRTAERSYSTSKVRRGGREEIPLVQGKEQRLHFAGAAVKRYPMSKVRETQVRR